MNKKFLDDLANNTPNESMFDNIKETEEDLVAGKSFKNFKEDLAMKTNKMKSSLDKAKSKLRSRFGSLSNVDYVKAMKAVGSTMAARLTARGMIKRASGKKEKGKLGKS